jgi:hypothetical protein
MVLLFLPDVFVVSSTHCILYALYPLHIVSESSELNRVFAGFQSTDEHYKSSMLLLFNTKSVRAIGHVDRFGPTPNLPSIRRVGVRASRPIKSRGPSPHVRRSRSGSADKRAAIELVELISVLR